MKEKKVNKKLRVIITILVIAVLIIGGVGGYYIYQNYEKNKTVGTAWGDKYYAYLKEVVSNTQADKNKTYGMPNNMKDTKIQFIETTENEPPKMEMTYNLDGTEYVNIYYIDDNDAVSFMEYKQPSTLELLYNIELKQYIWYVHIVEGNNHSYKTIDNKTDEQQAAEYTFTEEEIKVDNTTEGEETTPTISKFEETFVVPEIEDNRISIDLNSTVKEKALRESVKGAVETYKPEEKIITEEVKSQTEEAISKLETKREEIKKAEEEEKKKKEEEETAKKAEEEKSKVLQVGKYTLKYGKYTFSMVDEEGVNLSGTIILKADGKFHVKTNFRATESSDDSGLDDDGTYEVKLNQPTGYPGEYSNYIEFTPYKGDKFRFDVNGNNEFNDQWHGYEYSGD